jgi:anti-sigma B factor antagonist
MVRAMTDFAISVDRRDDRAIVQFAGELDLEGTPRAEAALHEVEEGSPPLLVVDLRPLEYIDSTGLSVLVRADRRARESGRAFAVVPNDRPVRRLLEMLGVGERLALLNDPEETPKA